MLTKADTRRRHTVPAVLLVLVVLAASVFWLGIPNASAAGNSVCAEVKIEIKQELTLERQGFDAHMRITNGLSHITLEDIDIDVAFADEAGNPVRASSDPDDTDALFFIRLDEDAMENINDVDGAGTISPSTTADIHWLIIPAPGAAGGQPKGTMYYVGATLTYTIGGEENVTRVTPDYIFVKPMPEIVLDYFLPMEVFGDDAFTQDITEPPIPFPLGVRVKNKGAGTARNMTIDSAQPKITENDQGLLVAFQIESSSVNRKPAEQSLLADFGDLPPGGTGVALWSMTCSLSGEFKDFDAGFTHSDELGGELTSLIKKEDIHTHRIVRDVRVDIAGRDQVPEFLAKDGDVYRVYESDAPDTEVTHHSNEAVLEEKESDQYKVLYDLTFPPNAGFVYVKTADPHNGQKRLTSVIRADGKRLKPENAWLSKSRNGEDPPGWDYYVNIFDAGTGGTYSLTFEDPEDASLPPELDPIANQVGVEDQNMEFAVSASDPDGTDPLLTATPLPVGATFQDAQDGTGEFSWTPAQGQAGRYTVFFRAADGELTDTRKVTVTIHPHDDKDGDGMTDAWEVDQFGDLSQDGTGDYDSDGLSAWKNFYSVAIRGPRTTPQPFR